MEEKIRNLGMLAAASFRVELDEVRRGRESTRRLVIRHPEAVVLVPVLDGDRTLVVSQYRYALNRQTLELPAGKVDPGETPDEAAHRELLEETGHRAQSLTRLHSFAPAPGYSNEIIHVYQAAGLTRAGDPTDTDEIEAADIVPLSEIRSMILTGRMISGTSIVAYSVFDWLRG